MADSIIAVLVSVDTPSIQGPLRYHGGYLRATSGGTATADVLNGTSAGGQFRDGFRAVASEHDQHSFEKGIECPAGIFVDLGSNVDQFVLYYSFPEPADGQ